MRWRRRAGLGSLALALLGCLTAAPARALSITVYGDMDLDYNRAVDGELFHDRREGLRVMSTIALGLATTKADLSNAPFAASLRRSDDFWAALRNDDPGASAAPNR